MNLYAPKSGITIMAATPENASEQFLQDAEKLGLVKSTLQPQNTSVWTSKQGLMGGPDTFMLLFQDAFYPMPAAVFNVLFTPIQEAETVPDTETATPAPTPLKGKSFYLDAGHGGKDSGAINTEFDLHEKIAALEIVLLLGTKLKQLGATVYYSREDDTYPTLTARANEANSLNVTCFVSVHLNAAENKDANGIETLVYGQGGTAYKIAEIVQANMVQVTGWRNRGVKIRPDLTVLAKTKMPAILAEVGFISNNAQAQELFKLETQVKLADAIADGLLTYYG